MKTVTSVEQVQQLMSAGIDLSTADMAYIKNPRDGHYLLVASTPMSRSDLPCWSMGALWNLCSSMGIALGFFTIEDSSDDIISILVNNICEKEKTK